VPDFSRLPEFAAETIGWPFSMGGRDRRGIDCWGLVLHLMARSGVDLPDYGSPTDWAVRAREFQAHWARHSTEVAQNKIQRGDAILFMACGATGPNHIALALSNRRMIQTNKVLGVHIAPIEQHHLSPLRFWAAVRPLPIEGEVA